MKLQPLDRLAIDELKVAHKHMTKFWCYDGPIVTPLDYKPNRWLFTADTEIVASSSL